MSELTDKLGKLVSALGAKGKTVEAGVLDEVRKLAEKVRALVGDADDEAAKVSNDVLAAANKVEAEATPGVSTEPAVSDPQVNQPEATGAPEEGVTETVVPNAPETAEPVAVAGDDAAEGHSDQQ